MAATWEIQIQVVDLATRKILVTATRTDGEDVRTYSIEGKYDRTHQTAQQILGQYTAWVWDEYRAEVAKEAQIAALIGQAENALATALNAKEIP